MARGEGGGLYFVFAGNALRQPLVEGHRLHASPGPAIGVGSGSTWIFLGVAVLTSLLLGAA